jgi:predicted dehydrogenase
MAAKIRCGVVGLGRIGSILEEDGLREKPCTHTGAILHNEDCNLVGGCDIDLERCRNFSTKWRCTNVFTDIEEFLKYCSPDIVHIATPPDTHLSIVETVLGSTVSLIICEKPLAHVSGDAERIAAIHRSGAVRIMTNHERRYSADYVAVQDHVKSERFGKLLSIGAHIYMGRRRPLMDMFLDDGTHLIDILRFLTGSELENIQVAYGHESLFVVCRAGEVPVAMEIGSGRDHIVFELELSFTSGRIRIGNGIYEEYESGKSPFYEGMKSLLHTGAEGPSETGYFSNMIADAVRCFRDKGAAPVSSAVDGWRSLQFIDRVKKLYEGGTAAGGAELEPALSGVQNCFQGYAK